MLPEWFFLSISLLCARPSDVANLFTRSTTIRQWPKTTASCSGVLPSSSGAVSRDGPALSIRITHARDMNLAARCSSDRLLSVSSVRSGRTFSTRGMSPRLTAMCNGVCSPAKASIFGFPQNSIHGFRMTSLVSKN